MKKFILLTLFFMITLTGIGTSCITKSRKTKKSNTLKIPLYFDISTLHYCGSNKGSYASSSRVIPHVFEGLMRRGEGDVPMPAIADTIDISEDRKTYTFHLKETEWSDGTPLTAQDFEYAWKMLIDPQSKSITAIPDLFYPIKNAENFLKGNCHSDEVGITTVDEKTLVVELEYPAQYFLNIVCSPFFYPVPRHIATKDPQWCNKAGAVCNGPFMLSEWTINSEIRLVKNSRYWDREHVYLDGIDLLVCQNDQTALHLFENGTVDWVGAPFMRIAHDCSHQMLTETAPDSGIYFFVFNDDRYPLNNQKLRKALNHAIDRDTIIDSIFKDTAQPARSALPHLLRLKQTPYFEDNNPTLARTLFEEALQDLGHTPESLPEIELLYMPELEWVKNVCLAIQDQWRKRLGLKVSLRGVLGRNEYIDTIRRGEHMIAITGTASIILDPAFILKIFKNKKDLCNLCNWENKRFQDLLDRSNHVLDEKERSKLLTAAEEILMEEMPMLPICSINKNYAKNPKLKGEQISQLSFVDFKSAYFERD
ncbi:MAG: peptide ABC transporter substrate-binding protein [Chlamydiota bacterium]